MKFMSTVVAILAAASAVFGQAKEEKGSRNVELIEFQSRVFKNKRTLRVLVPPGYHEKENVAVTYPVFYLNDGYAVFNYSDAEKTVY